MKNIEILQKEDDLWISIKSSKGNRCLLSIDSMLIKHPGIIGQTIKEWAEDNLQYNPENNKNQYDPDYTVHPGDHIVEHLRCMDVKKYWEYVTATDKSYLLNIISSKKPIDREAAAFLECVLGIPADFWLTLQRNHDKGIEKNG